MLLSILVLIGAILVPSEYAWLYSTHIILLCLYLIFTKRWLVLFMVFLSCFVVIISELHQDLSFEQELTHRDWQFSPLTHVIYGELTPSFKHGSAYSLRLTDQQDQPHDYENVPFKPRSEAPKDTFSVYFYQVIEPDKNASWLSRKLYTHRQAALLKGHIHASTSQIMDLEEFSLRRWLYSKLDKQLSSFPSWRYTKALLLGDDSAWDERDKWEIRSLGLAHLFVVSGLHTGFVFAIGAFLSRLIWPVLPKSWLLYGITSWQLDIVVVLPMLWGYAYLTDWGAPVVRAAVMLSAYLLSRIWLIRLSPYHIVGLALWGMLLLNPRQVLEPGLWLSFSLVCLLIAFFQTNKRWYQILFVQVMLSTASLVLIWGWQGAISVLSIPVNLVMIPFAAVLWFPFSIFACFEVLVFQTHYAYEVMNHALVYVLKTLDYVAFQLPLIAFNDLIGSFAKVLLLLLVAFWVWQTPLRRGWLCLVIIWCVLILPRDTFSHIDARFENVNDELVFKQGERLVASPKWANHPVSSEFASIFPAISEETKRPHFLLAGSKDTLSSMSLLEKKVNWVILPKEPAKRLQARLNGLKIDWITIPSGESLLFRKEKGHISVRHDACSFAIFLFKSDTCRRVEKLEFMLN